MAANLHVTLPQCSGRNIDALTGLGKLNLQ